MNTFKDMSYRSKLLFIFVSFSLLNIFIIGMFMLFLFDKKHTSESMMRVQNVYEQKEKSFQAHIAGIEEILSALKHSKLLEDYVEDPSKENLRIAKELFFDMASSRGNLMQLRYIDINGMERIRIDRDDEDTLPYAVSQMQAKMNRYYVQKGLQTPENQVWYSKIDLNIENGKLEEPVKPVLRAVVPFFHNDTLQGLVVANIFMQKFMDDLVSSEEETIYVLDQEGKILVSTDHQHDWSRYISGAGSVPDDFHFNDLKLNDTFYSKTMHFANTEGLELVVSPENVGFTDVLNHELKAVFGMLLLVSLLSVPLAYFFARYPTRLEQEIEEHNRYLQMRVDRAIDQYVENEKMLLHQHRLAQMGELLSMIAHQWRQPLSTIAAITASLKIKLQFEKECDKENLDEQLTEIGMQTQNLSEVIKDFQDFYQPDLPMISVCIDELVESSLNIVSAQFEAENITVHKDLQAKGMIKVHANHLKQAIVAILQNAQDACMSQEVQNRTIEIKTRVAKGFHTIEISDHAGGIAEEIQENIFMPYFSTKEDKNGTGMGLYMTKIIAEKHCRGNLHTHNSPDGAVFTLRIPE